MLPPASRCLERDLPSVLVVDNDEAILHALADRLRAAGYRCLTAMTASQALGILARQDVDLVVTDLNMPGYDGLDLIRLLRGTCEVPVVVITAYPEREAECGVDELDYLTKPFAWSDLLSRVQVHTGQSA